MPHLEALVGLDQVGFMQKREARDGITRVIDLMQKICKEVKNCCLLVIDAEKAFDRVNLVFMLQTLEAVGLGRNFIALISAIYKCPKAQIRVNSVLSETLDIKNGTRQGFPLSLLLFFSNIGALLEINTI